MTLDFVVAEAILGGTDRVATSMRASAIISRHSRAMLQVSDHQAMRSWGSILIMLRARPCRVNEQAGKSRARAAAITKRRQRRLRPTDA